MNKKQTDLFKVLSRSGVLVFACGPKGISANIVGEFSIQYFPSHNEHRLIMGNGDQHIHVDWSRVKFVEYSISHGEGILTFKDSEEVLFKLYRMDGDYSDEVKVLLGSLF